MNILIVLTSHQQLGNTGKPTGFWFEELATPYYAFLEAGATVTLASPQGGLAPVDPESNEPHYQSDTTRQFEKDATALRLLANTRRLDQVDASEFDAVFYPGGYGPLWDLVTHPASIALIEAALHAGTPVGAVCHAPAVLRYVKNADGMPLISGKRVTGFSNAEEAALERTKIVPFLVEDALRAAGANYAKAAADWAPHVETDGALVTGQNPASARDTAQAVLALLLQDTSPI